MNRINLYFVVFLTTTIGACQPKETPADSEQTEPVVSETPQYPEELATVFAAHGGIDLWDSMQSLYFEIVNDEGNEKHYIQLTDRRDRVESNGVIMGYDGTDVWLEADSSYKRDPVFYHNLMFYFYAMPFVFGDDGIIYSEAKPLIFDGVSYPGIRVAYNDGVGASSKDEYYIHYDAETNQMAWLGYTVTYFSKEESQDVHWIRYNDWQNVNGLKLPNSISWYNYEDGLPLDFRDSVSFAGVQVKQTPHPDALFVATPGASINE